MSAKTGFLGDAMDLHLRVSKQSGDVEIHLFKGFQDPKAYKHFTLSVLRRGKKDHYPLSADELQDLFRMVRAAQIAPIVPGSMGLDGESYHLEIQDFATHVTYSWWMYPGEGWVPLSEIASHAPWRFTPNISLTIGKKIGRLPMNTDYYSK